METPYVITLPAAWGGAGPIAPATALGVVEAMRAALAEALGDDALGGRTVAVQGLGMVCHEVVRILREAGATVYAGDIDADKVRRVVEEFAAVPVEDPNAMHALDVDVYCPCALGATINDRTIEALRCRVIAGSANNQPHEERHGDRPQEKGIVYAPDCVANAGGTIYDTDRLLPGGMNHERAVENVRRIRETTRQILRIARKEGIPSCRAADRLAERRIQEVARSKALRTASDVRIA